MNASRNQENDRLQQQMFCPPTTNDGNDCFLYTSILCYSTRLHTLSTHLFNRPAPGLQCSGCCSISWPTQSGGVCQAANKTVHTSGRDREKGRIRLFERLFIRLHYCCTTTVMSTCDIKKAKKGMFLG